MKKYSKQQILKLLAKKCFFCPEKNYAILDAHRIQEGCDGGKYTFFNTLVVCANDHRRIHAKEIIIDRKYAWTGGGYVVHFWENGEEKWIPEKQ